jgi:hypothetical protein
MLDLYGRKGGAAMGYVFAGWDVVRVDIEDHPEGPGDFVQADAIEFLKEHGHEFDAVHASPPCQANIAITAGNRSRGWVDDHVNLIPRTRDALGALGKPYVIENGPSRHLRGDLVLCGEQFGLDVIRHRYFELGGWSTAQPAHRKHRGRTRGWRHGQYFDGPYVAVYGKGGGKASVAEAQEAMGIWWMDDIVDLNEAIPPAYTEYVGWQLLAHIAAERAA